MFKKNISYTEHQNVLNTDYITYEHRIYFIIVRTSENALIYNIFQLLSELN